MSGVPGPIALQPELYGELIAALKDAYATRYLSAAGLVVLLYDHILTFSEEIRLVWRAPHSFPKYAFLFNRYLVLSCLIPVAHEMSGLTHNAFTTFVCRHLLFATSILAIFSVGIANTLVLLRVMILWDHRPFVVKVITAGFIASFSAQVVCMGLALANLAPTVMWSDIANMCIVTSTTPTFIAVWAAPMLFEVLVLVLTILNALDRPRGAQLPVVKALYRDGIIYFVALTALRALNLGFASIRQPSLIMLGAFFVWAMTTTVLNRSLLSLSSAEMKHMKYDETMGPIRSGRGSPFDLGKTVGDIEMPTYDRVSRVFSR